MSLNHQEEEVSLTLLEVIESKPLMNAMAEGKAEDVSFIVDSGAAKTVIPQSTARHVAAVKGTKHWHHVQGHRREQGR